MLSERRFGSCRLDDLRRGVPKIAARAVLFDGAAA